MSTTLQPPRTAPAAGPGEGPRLDRVCVGVLAIAAGIGWIADNAGAAVPWRLFPSFGLMAVGLALLASARAGHGRGELIGLGAALLVAALVTGMADGRFVGPVGDRTLTPGTGDGSAGDQTLTPDPSNWPTDTRLSAGKITVDLTRHPLPETGRLAVSVGAGEINVLLPPRARVRIDAEVSVGNISRNGRDVRSGIDVQWTDPGPPGAGVQLDLRVGVGSIGVDDA